MTKNKKIFCEYCGAELMVTYELVYKEHADIDLPKTYRQHVRCPHGTLFFNRHTEGCAGDSMGGARSTWERTMEYWNNLN